MTTSNTHLKEDGFRFVHLYAHSEYSFYQSTATVHDLVDRATQLGMPALALTDAGNMYGAMQFYRACKREGIKPILGTEAMLAGGGLPDRLILLARDADGYRNLVRLYDGTNPVDAWGISVVDERRLLSGAGGLVCIVPGMRGRAQQQREWLARLAGMFDHGCLFLGLERYAKSDNVEALTASIDLARTEGVLLVAINDIRCLESEENLQLFRSNGRNTVGYDCVVPDPAGTGHWFRDGAEMVDLFADIPESIANTQAIARMVNLELDLETQHAPQDHIPRVVEVVAEDGPSRLRRLVMAALPERYPICDDAITSRVEHELGVIAELGLADQFLMLGDLVAWAREHDIPVGSGHGPAPASIVNYILGITGVDPLHFGLVFERFINPMWKNPPFIAIDIGYERREELIAHLGELYGNDNIAAVAEFFSSPDSDDDSVVSARLSGLRCRVKVSPASMLVARPETMALLPRYKEAGSNRTIVQYTKDQAMALGALVFDISEMEVLTHLHHVVHHLEACGNTMDLDAIPMDDAATMALFKAGNTNGIFLFDDDRMKRVLIEVRPDSFADLMMIYALNRPGFDALIPAVVQAKTSKNIPARCCAAVDAVLRETYGQLLYHEQVIFILHSVFGFDFAAADVIRRHIEHKFAPGVAAAIDAFKKRSLEKGLEEGVWKQLLDCFLNRAGYTFSKAHAAAYVKTAWQCAYLKAHFPVEFTEDRHQG